MVTRITVSRPKVVTWVQWNGDNLDEANTTLNRQLSISPNGHLQLPGIPGFAGPTVAIGNWVSSEFVVRTTDELNANEQDVVSDGPLRYNLTDESA